MCSLNFSVVVQCPVQSVVFVEVYLHFLSVHTLTECEKLIRNMLKLDPSRRISLSAVLRHPWMQGVEPEPEPLSTQMRVFGSLDNLLWNDVVLKAIQTMNYNLEACKQVLTCSLVQNFPIC